MTDLSIQTKCFIMAHSALLRNTSAETEKEAKAAESSFVKDLLALLLT